MEKKKQKNVHVSRWLKSCMCVYTNSGVYYVYTVNNNLYSFPPVVIDLTTCLKPFFVFCFVLSTKKTQTRVSECIVRHTRPSCDKRTTGRGGVGDFGQTLISAKIHENKELKMRGGRNVSFRNNLK